MEKPPTVTIRHRNLVIQSIESGHLVIWCHGYYFPGTVKTTVPSMTTVVWHAPQGEYGVLTKGARYITGSRSEEVLRDWGETAGGMDCDDYVLTTKRDDPVRPIGAAVCDYLTIVPDQREHLSTVWEAMRIHHLHYSVVHFYACRVPI
jgi:hypothetical protein